MSEKQEDVLQANMGFFTEEDAQEIAAPETETTETEAETTEEVAATTEEGMEATTEEATTEEAEQEAEVTEPESTNPYIKTETVPEEIEIKDINDVFTSLNTLGYDIKDEKGLSVVVDELKAFKSAEADNKERLEDLTGYESFFSGLPTDLYDIVTAYAEGKDYRETLKSLSNQSIDFTVPFSRQDEFDLITFYHPDAFSDREEFDDEKDTTSTKLLLKGIKGQYEGNQSSIRDKESRVGDIVKQNTKQLVSSANESISTFSNGKSFEKGHTDSIAKTMNAGKEGVLGLFFDEKGLWKKDSAASLSKLMMFDTTIKEYQSMRLRDQKTIKNLLSRSGDQSESIGKGKRKASSKETIRTEVGAMFPSESGKHTFQ